MSYTLKQLSDLSSTPISTIQSLARNGEIGAVQENKSLIYTDADLAKLNAIRKKPKVAEVEFARVIHLIGDEGKGGIAIAYVWKKGQSFISVATEVCSIQDAYNRKHGRARVLENLANGEFIRIPYVAQTQKNFTPSEWVKTLFYGQLV